MILKVHLGKKPSVESRSETNEMTEPLTYTTTNYRDPGYHGVENWEVDNYQQDKMVRDGTACTEIKTQLFNTVIPGHSLNHMAFNVAVPRSFDDQWSSAVLLVQNRLSQPRSS